MDQKTVGRKEKAKQGAGEFTVLPNGRVRWRGSVTTYTGEQLRVSGTEDNMKAAQAAFDQFKSDAKEDKFQSRKDSVTISNLVEEYIETRYRAGKLKQRTIDDYHYMLSHYITPTIGKLLAQKVDGKRLKTFFDHLETKVEGSRTRQKLHSLLRAAYRWGIQERKVKHDPTTSGLPRPTKKVEKKNAFEPEEAAKFYMTAREERTGWPLALMLALGLRPGEAIGLKWSDVQFVEDGTVMLTINRTRSVSQGKVYEDTPKTPTAKRRIRATGDIAQMLAECKGQHEAEKALQTPVNGHPYRVTDYVFTTLAGTGWRSDNLNVPMRKICEKAELPVLTPQMLRRTYASVMGASGHALEVISRQLGHTNTKTTEQFYRKVYDSERADMTYDPMGQKRTKTKP